VVIPATFEGLTRTATLLVQPVPAPPPPPPVPAAPTGLTARAVFDGQINLSWTDNSRNETGFALFRREGAGDWLRLALLGPNITRFADLEVRAGATYTYRVQADLNGRPSGWSNEATITLAPPPQAPAAPTNLTATAFSATEIGLIWKDNSRDEAAFVLYRQAPGGDSAPIATLPANSTSYLDRGLRPGTTYRYLVRAWNPGIGASRRSNEAVATTRPAQ
jgi:titin